MLTSSIRTCNARADVASFHRVRPRLFGIAYRVLGNRADADDIVQDTWVRWQGTDRTVVRDPAAFLATTTTRLAINMKQSASARRVTCIGSSLPDVIDTAADPCRSAEQSDMLEHAAVLLLAKLTPAERAVFVLREAFDYPYRRIAEVLELSEANARQIHKRACAHLSAADRNAVDTTDRQRLVDAFRVAAHEGDLESLEEVLDADVTGRVSGAVALAA